VTIAGTVFFLPNEVRQLVGIISEALGRARMDPPVEPV